MITIKDVARRAKVSIATVSHVLSDSGRIGEDTRQRVRKAVAELDYRPSFIARSLKSRRTHTIGMVISDITNPFFPEMVRGAEDAAAARGYLLSIFNTDDRPERERQVFRVLETRRLDGVLLVVALERGPLPHVEKMLTSGTPVVCLDRRPRGIAADTVMVDNASAVALGIEHLIASGYRRIAYIGGAPSMYIAPDRLRGYRSAMKEAGLPMRAVHGDFRRESGHRAAMDLLTSPDRPDALFVANLLMAAGALEAAHGLSLHTPEHFGLVTFDSIDLMSGFGPDLTTVVQPSYELGHQGANLLLDRIEGVCKTPPVTLKLPCRLKVGDSSRPR
ncbi:MAG: LacI family DNA-binding transcriptional regulator [Bryobacteraceae bacterium]|nr:LacI family DNA-binding transcriptional regulator [Bryobacteraceae bacterium]